LASDSVLDFEHLLTPIPGDDAAGEDLRADPASVYYEIREAQRKARQAEKPKPFEDRDGSADALGDWKEVGELGRKMLAEQSKDLQVTAWLIEALARSDGFAGLRDGFRLARELVERFWGEIHPRPDDEGVAATVWPLTSLNGEDTEGPLVKAIRRIPVTNGQEYGPFPLWRLRQAEELELLEPDKRQQRIEENGAITRDMFDRSVAETPPEWFRNLLDDLQECKDELAQLESTLEEKCGEDDKGIPLAPSTSSIRTAVNECLDAVVSISKDMLAELDSPGEGDVAADGTPAGQPGAPPAVQVGAINSRDTAFRALRDVAKFFRQTEPHSPVSYAIEQILRWGKMSLPELLSDETFKQVGALLTSDRSEAEDE
jgi:type VI secretion system protein ImpA